MIKMTTRKKKLKIMNKIKKTKMFNYEKIKYNKLINVILYFILKIVLLIDIIIYKKIFIKISNKMLKHLSLQKPQQNSSLIKNKFLIMITNNKI